MSDRRAMSFQTDPTLSADPPVTKVVVTPATAVSAPARRISGPFTWMFAALLLTWLGGHLGESRFTVLIGGEGLRASGDLGLASGLRMLVGVPGAILELVRVEPGWFGLGFLMLLVPTAALVAARPDSPRTPGTTSLAAAAALLASGVLLGILAWLGGTTRGDVLAAGLLDAKQFPGWIERLERIAGLDWMLALASAAWTALAFRLPLPRWSTVGVGALGVLATFSCWYAASGTLGTVGQFDLPRPLAFAGTSDAAREPIVGTLAGRAIAMGGGEFPGLHTASDGRIAFSSPQSLREFLTPAVD